MEVKVHTVSMITLGQLLLHYLCISRSLQRTEWALAPLCCTSRSSNHKLVLIEQSLILEVQVPINHMVVLHVPTSPCNTDILTIYKRTDATWLHCTISFLTLRHSAIIWMTHENGKVTTTLWSPGQAWTRPMQMMWAKFTCTQKCNIPFWSLTFNLLSWEYFISPCTAICPAEHTLCWVSVQHVYTCLLWPLLTD